MKLLASGHYVETQHPQLVACYHQGDIVFSGILGTCMEETVLGFRMLAAVEGRLTGIYKPNSSKQQQSSPKDSTFFDTFYGATTRLNASSFSPYSNPSMSYRSSEVLFPSVHRPFYSNQSYKAMKPSSSATPSPPLVSQMTNEYCLELARGLARKALSVTTTPHPNLQSSIIQGGLGNSPIPGIQQNEDIFGYRFEICRHSLLTRSIRSQVW